MILIGLVVSLSFFLESICSNFINMNNSLLIPLFSIISLIIIYPYFNNDNLKFIYTCAVIGLFYDIVFTNTLIFNMVIFVAIGFVIKLINVFISNNPLNVTLISLICILLYRVTTYVVLVVIGYISFNSVTLIKGIYSSIVLNIIYAIIVYLVTDYYSKKFRIAKID